MGKKPVAFALKTKLLIFFPDILSFLYYSNNFQTIPFLANIDIPFNFSSAKAGMFLDKMKATKIKNHEINLDRCHKLRLSKHSRKNT